MSSKSYMVAVCDILGFTNLVRKQSLDSVIHSSFEYVRKALYHSMYKDGFPDKVPSLVELQKHSQLGLAWFSDTIFIYTLEDTDNNVRALTSTVGWLIFETMMVPYSRLRCGIAYGEAYIDSSNSIYVGNPIIEAFQLEKSQQWAGGALTENAVERIPAEGRTGRFYLDWWLTPYAVPLKDGIEFETLALNWTAGLHFKQTFNFLHSQGDETKDISEKRQNTMAFHDSVCHMCQHTDYEGRIIGKPY